MPVKQHPQPLTSWRDVVDPTIKAAPATHAAEIEHLEAQIALVDAEEFNPRRVFQEALAAGQPATEADYPIDTRAARRATLKTMLESAKRNYLKATRALACEKDSAVSLLRARMSEDGREFKRLIAAAETDAEKDRLRLEYQEYHAATGAKFKASGPPMFAVTTPRYLAVGQFEVKQQPLKKPTLVKKVIGALRLAAGGLAHTAAADVEEAGHADD